MNWIRRTGLLAGLMSLLLLTATTGALAATVSEVVDDASTTGFYLERGVSISESDATEIVTAARNNGSRFYLVVLSDTPLGGNTAFAESAFDQLNLAAGTMLVLSPEDVGWISDNEGFAESDMELAYEHANDQGGNDAEYAANFVVALVGEPAVAAATPAETSTPATTAAASSAAAESSGGGGNGFLWFILIAGAIGLFLFFLMKRGGKQTVNAAAEQMAKARMAVQKQVDAVANDILDMEDEVRIADNAEVDAYYETASETYRTVTDQLPKAETPQRVVELSNDLDTAIWQLDCAEAVLDGKPKPPRPEPKRLESEARPTRDRVTTPAPRPDYQRRPTRRSSYLGPGVMEILIGVAGQVLSGGGSSRGGGLGGMFRRPPSSGGSSSRVRSRGGSGGGVVPGPGAPVQRRSTRSSSTRRSSRSRRSGGGRIRGGGKRRK